VYPPTVGGAAEPAFELADGRIERGVEVPGAGFAAYHGTARFDGDFDPLTQRRLASVGFVEKLDVYPNEFVVVPADFFELVTGVLAVMVRNLDVTALDNNVHA
jgi:hypothetical protein